MASGQLTTSTSPAALPVTQEVSRRVLARGKAQWLRHHPSPLPLRRAYSRLYWRRLLRSGRELFTIQKTHPSHRPRKPSNTPPPLFGRPRRRAPQTHTQSPSRSAPPRRRRALRGQARVRARARAKVNNGSRPRAASRRLTRWRSGRLIWRRLRHSRRCY